MAMGLLGPVNAAVNTFDFWRVPVFVIIADNFLVIKSLVVFRVGEELLVKLNR